MEILVGLIIVFVLGIVITRFTYASDFLDFVVFVMTRVSGIMLLSAVIVLPVSHMEVKSNAAEFASIQQTVTSARKQGQSIENAALQLEVSTANRWLAKTQYWNDTVLGLWIPDFVDNLEPIE